MSKKPGPVQYVMSQPKVVVTRRWPDVVEQKLCELFDAELNADDLPMTAEDLTDALRSADALLPTVTDAINADVLSAEPLRAAIVASYGVGFNHIDLDAAAKRGLTVTNTPEVLTDCTADLAITLMLMVARRTGEGDRLVRADAWTGWRPTHMMGAKMTGKILGLIGMGRIGKAVAARAHRGFGMDVLFHDPIPMSAEDAKALGATPCPSLEDLLRRSDFVSLHCPGGEATHHLINADRLALMKPSAFLINTARGGLIDETALVAALNSSAIAGAGLDVYEAEPRVSPALRSMENVVLLPHLGSASLETRVAMGMRVVDNLVAFFDGQTPHDKLV